MNKFIISLSFIFTLSLHLIVFYFYKTENIQNTTSLNNTKIVSIQLSKLENKKTNPEIPQIKEEQEEIKKENSIKKETIKPTKKVLPNKPQEKIQKIEEQKKEEPIQNTTDISTTPQKQVENSTNIEKNNENEKKDSINEEKFILEYGKKVRETINQNKTYPNISKKLKEEGLVIISFRVLKNGEIENINIKLSSNKERLDKAALNAVNETNNFEAFDENIKKPFLDFQIPLEFSIK